MRELLEKLGRFLAVNSDVDFFVLKGDDIDNEAKRELQLTSAELWFIRRALRKYLS